MGVPLTSGSDVVGVIGLASGTTERAFGPREIDAMIRFAQLASIALENARLNDAVQRGALYDPTTSLPNRELLHDRIDRALASARQDRSSLAVVLLDLDRFVVINETLGHAVGDRLLASVAQRLSRMVRLGDTVARFSGAEFAILLDPVADADEARQIAERIGTELRTPFPLNGRDWFISASIGIAMATPGLGRTTPDELLREAEVAMVRAKADSAIEPDPVRAVDEHPDPRAHRPRERPARRPRARPAARPLPAHRGAAAASRSSASRRSSAGSTRAAAWSRPSPSSRWPRRPA